MRVQLKSKFIPVNLNPRIGGVPVLVSQIKSTYSNYYVNDGTTPMNFYLEYADIDGALQVLTWNPSSSTDSTIQFPTPAGFFDNKQKYSVLFYWTVTNLSNVIIEQVYTEDPITLEINDQHDDI